LWDTVVEIIATRGYHWYRKMVVSCVDANTGAHVAFNETVNDHEKAVISSSSIPVAFPTTIWPYKGYKGPNQTIVCMDGGVAMTTNLYSAISRCREQVDSDEDIVLDVIVCGNPQLSAWKNPNNAFDTYMRYRDIKEYRSQMNDMLGVMESYPNVTYRYYVPPSADLGNAMDFDNATTWSM
jgi:predicted acylesterase/phospholipase RssA